ncbi:MAG: hypothetical protein Q3990_03025 [Desulfovibrionaceae bacterium]|nr:hypothetical protein [Desulfovibrionaceae bacterium]
MQSLVKKQCFSSLLAISFMFAPLNAMALEAGTKPAGSAQPEAAAVQKTQAEASSAAPATAQAPAPATAPAASESAHQARPETSAKADSAKKDAAGQTAQKAASEPCGHEPTLSSKPPMTLIRHLERETDLPAMQLSLGLVNFVGETAPLHDGEDAYAIMPLDHDAVLEVYDLHYDGQELTEAQEPVMVRKMGPNEAYVLKVPNFGGMPSKGICVVSNNRRNCWNPGDDKLNEGFLRWSKTKNIK